MIMSFAGHMNIVYEIKFSGSLLKLLFAICGLVNILL